MKTFYVTQSALTICGIFDMMIVIMSEPGGKGPKPTKDMPVFDSEALKDQIQDAPRKELSILANKVLEAGRQGEIDTATVDNLLIIIGERARELSGKQRESSVDFDKNPVEIPFNPIDAMRDPAMKREKEILAELKQLVIAGDDAGVNSRRRALSHELAQMAGDPGLGESLRYDAECYQVAMFVARDIFLLAQRAGFQFHSKDELEKLIKPQLERFNQRFSLKEYHAATMVVNIELLKFKVTIGGKPLTAILSIIPTGFDNIRDTMMDFNVGNF